MDRKYTDEQFNYILEVLIYYKQSFPEKDVFLSEKSLKDAVDHFMKMGNNFKFNNKK
tara:strand:- start:2792 stop:2962 length:171 start_codon:yes stop_codon:yes gene_type:complete